MIVASACSLKVNGFSSASLLLIVTVVAEIPEDIELNLIENVVVPFADMLVEYGVPTMEKSVVLLRLMPEIDKVELPELQKCCHLQYR